MAMPGQVCPEVGEALRAEDELAHDEQCPALTHDVEGAGDAARVAVRALASHGFIVAEA